MTPSLRHRSEAGQTTALVLSMLFTLTMFVALVVNVGQMVNRRVALQVIADTGAWTGATVQAVQLNHYAYWSRMVQNAYKNASAVSLGFNASECYSGWAAVGVFTYANSGMARAMIKFRGKAFSEAYNHSMYNIDDLFPGESGNFRNGFSTMAGPEDGNVFAVADGNIVPLPLFKGDKLYTGDHAWRNETVSQLPIELSAKLAGISPFAVSKAGSGYESWPCATLLPPTISTVYMIGPPGYKLVTLGQPYIFVWRVKESRPTKALFFDRFLGPNAVPAMTAVAVAKAVGGDVHRGRSRYRAKMVPVSRYSLTGGFIQDSLARTDRLIPGSLRQIVH
jgi:hypothetical protein